MLQNRHGGRGASFNPLVVRTHTVELEPLNIISVDIPPVPVISLVVGATFSPTIEGSSSNPDATPVASSSKTLDKSTAAGSSSTSMNRSGGGSGSGSGPSQASSSRGQPVAASITGMDYRPKQGHQPAGGRGNHSKLTCLASPGGFNDYSNVPSAAADNNSPGATAFTRETSTPTGLTTDSKARALTTLRTSSGVATGTTDGAPSATLTGGVGARKGHSHLSREVIIGVVVALGVVIIGAIILAYRFRRRASRKDGSSAIRAQDNLLGRSTNTRSRPSNSSNEESGILSNPPFAERKGSSTRSSKRPPDIIIHPSSLSSQHRQESRHSNSAASPARSQYIVADADSIIIDGSRPPTPLSPLIIITTSENYPSLPSRIRSPQSATHFQNKYTLTSYRPTIDVDIPPIPPLPSSPPPVPPGSPSRPQAKDPFADPPSPSTI